MSTPAPTRFCPLCGADTAADYCAQDGTRTVVRRSLAAGTSRLEIDEVIDDRYRVTGLLGRGGFGAVYTAVHTGTGQAIAIKVMVVGDGGAPDVGAVRRFYKEAQVTAQLRHPNTVRVFDVGQTSAGALYIAMELLHGGTLEDRFSSLAAQGQVLGVRGALDVGIPVLRSLAEAHRNDLVHRDLKPANIMLSEVVEEDEPLVKVLDFGIARTQDSSLTGQGTALGTPAYMSPEQCMGGAVDGRSDLYSLGVILYRSVTGRLPFEDRNPLTIMYKHAHGTPEPVQSAARVPVSESFAAIVHRALAKQPGERFATAREMRTALETARDDAALAASDQTWQYLRSVTPASSPDGPAAGLEADAHSDTLAAAAVAMGLAPGASAAAGAAAAGSKGATPLAAAPLAEVAADDTAMVVAPAQAPTAAVPVAARRWRGPVAAASALLLVGGGALAYAVWTQDDAAATAAPAGVLQGSAGQAGKAGKAGKATRIDAGATAGSGAATPDAAQGAAASDLGDGTRAHDAGFADAGITDAGFADAGSAGAGSADATAGPTAADGATLGSGDPVARPPAAQPPPRRPTAAARGAARAERRARQAARRAARDAARRAENAAKAARRAAAKRATKPATKPGRPTPKPAPKPAPKPRPTPAPQKPPMFD